MKKAFKKITKSKLILLNQYALQMRESTTVAGAGRSFDAGTLTCVGAGGDCSFGGGRPV
ncbi:MAG TPA: hypothetical protein VD993_16260 [Chitinophagaceae bacterium]|nr:hypothetical protein [Chitinophagaceae bacterium]